MRRAPGGLSIPVVMVRAGLAMSRRGPWAVMRNLAIALGSFGLALGLSAAYLSGLMAQDRTAHSDAIRPTFTTSSSAPLRAGYGFDSVDDQPVTVVVIWPRVSHAPLPPGLGHWPRPGEAALSPSLLELLGSARSGLYGHPTEVLSRAGLESPTELRVYLRPRGEDQLPAGLTGVSGFGESREGVALGAPSLNASPRWQVLGLLLMTLVLPALVALWAASKIDGPIRERRLKALEKLGVSTSQKGILTAAESLPAATAGVAVVGLLLVVLAQTAQLHVPYLGMAWEGRLLAGRSLPVLGLLIGCLCGSVACVVALRARSRRVTGAFAPGSFAARARAQFPRWSGRSPLLLALIAAGTVLVTQPGVLTTGSLRTLAYLAGVCLCGALLPSAVARVCAVLGEELAQRGLASDSPALFLGGRRLGQMHERTARIASALALAFLVLGQVHLWSSSLGGQYYDALVSRAQMGDHVLFASRVSYTPGVLRFAESLPRGSYSVWLSDTEPVNGEDSMSRIEGGCQALRLLGLACRTGVQDITNVNAELSQILAAGQGGLQVRVEVRADPSLETLTKEQARLVVFSAASVRLDVDGVKKRAFEEAGGGLQLASLGQGWITQGLVTKTKGLWVMAYGMIGIVLLSASAATTLLSDLLYSRRSLRRVILVSGSTRWVLGFLGIAVTLPVAFGVVTAGVLYLVLPQGISSMPEVHFSPSPVLALSGVVVTLTCVVSCVLWAYRAMVRHPETDVA